MTKRLSSQMNTEKHDRREVPGGCGRDGAGDSGGSNGGAGGGVMSLKEHEVRKVRGAAREV
eukprot:3648188-Pleurochrysis_carterae.AAC.2